MIELATEFYSITLDEDQEVVILDWKREVTTFEFLQGCREVFDVINRRQLKKCMLFTSSSVQSPVEDGEWEVNIIENEFATSSLIELSLALVMSEEKYQRMIQSYSISHITRLESPLNINYFTSKEEALDWLMHEPSMVMYARK